MKESLAYSASDKPTLSEQEQQTVELKLTEYCPIKHALQVIPSDSID